MQASVSVIAAGLLPALGPHYQRFCLFLFVLLAAFSDPKGEQEHEQDKE